MAYPKGAKHPKLVGDITTAVVMSKLIEVYGDVLIPFGENSRYDLLVEQPDGRFLRVQCKTGRLRNGVVLFPSSSVSYHPWTKEPEKPRRRDYRGAADVFGVYCPENGAVYLVPVEDVGRVQGALRIDPPLNRQARNIRWARHYRFPPREGEDGHHGQGRLSDGRARYAVSKHAGVAQMARATHL